MSNKSILDDVRVASPCNARWEDMTGDDRARFCAHCQKHVFNLSAMTQAEAETLVRKTEGKFCGRFRRRNDGRMLTADCPTGLRRRRSRVARWCGATFAMLLMLLGGKATLRSAESKSGDAGAATATNSVDDRVKMGKVAVPPTVMGDICVSTNVPPPPSTNLPPIMGQIRVPPVRPDAPSSPTK